MRPEVFFYNLKHGAIVLSSPFESGEFIRVPLEMLGAAMFLIAAFAVIVSMAMSSKRYDKKPS